MDKRFDKVLISAWRYHSYRTEYLHFMATPESCDLLITCFDELTTTSSRPRRAIPLRELRVQNDPTGFNDSFSWFRRLRIEVVADDPELKQMSVSTEGDHAVIAVHPRFVPRVKDALESVKGGADDFAIGPETRRKVQAGERDRASLLLMFWADPHSRNLRR